MLPLPPFRWEAPDQLSQLAALASTPGARLVSGGTDLLPSMKHRLFRPDVLVSTRRVPELRQVTARPDGSLSLGASLTLRELAALPELRASFPALAAAMGTVATPTIQAMATLGGNLMLDTRCMYYNQPAGWRAALGGCLKCEGTLCHVAPRGTGCYAAHSADTVPVLMLLGAKAVFETPAGPLTRLVGELQAADGRDGPPVPVGAVLTRLELPAPTRPVAYRKLRERGAIDYPLLLTAVAPTGTGWEAVISAVGPRPITVIADTREGLADAVHRAVQPLPTHQQASTWRKRMLRVEVSRALAQLPA
jgi:4-hydroxybenzoyl-CoA reductase subunit beta